MSSLMPFLSFGSGALGQGSDRSLEIGLASKVRLGGAIDLISSISVGEPAINFGLDDQSDLIGLVKAEFGVKQLSTRPIDFSCAMNKAIFRQGGH